ncbi:hypothetical protein MHA_2536 [Mannheimia haemolytica PHL213]|nr:hypothetical protein MHA_2536 [Mannheimia haemolytica PHL213]
MVRTIFISNLYKKTLNVSFFKRVISMNLPCLSAKNLYNLTACFLF